MRHLCLTFLFSSLLIACGGSSDSSPKPEINNQNSQIPGQHGPEQPAPNPDSGDSETPEPPPPEPVPEAALVDIVTYNIEWLGNPKTAGFNGTVEQQIYAAANDILDGQGEVYALQEIGGQSALSKLITQLNSLDGQNNWDGGISQSSAQQSLAFVYKTNIVSNVSFETMLTNQSSQPFAGRYPYMMTADIVINDTSRTLRMINLHLKCCNGNSNAARRASAMAILVPYIHQQYSNDNVIVLGDLNVAQKGGANGEILDWGIYNDRDNDDQADFFHAAGSVEDTEYIPSNPDSDIDHILVSNELKNAWLAVSELERNRYLITSASDHSPVVTTLDLSKSANDSSPPTPPDDSSPPDDDDSGDNTPPPSGSGIQVSQALAEAEGNALTVVGKIKAAFNEEFALELVDTLDASKTIIVKLESSQRAQWSPKLSPSVIGKFIQITGKRDVYSHLPSIEGVSEIIEVSE